jgi:dTDP-4-amino-4,6-dideoxygalactose transaminase
MSYKIPLFDLNFDEAESKAAYDVIKSGWISTGPKCLEFEEKFASMLGAKHAVSLANCTVALHLALVILGIKDGDEVIVPSLTFVATANAVRYVNATPVFADIVSLEEPTIDPEDIRSKITSKTKAIIVMHYAGFPCRMDEIMLIAEEYNLKVVEDACHGPLSEYKGKKLGTIGDIGCFSFFSNKNISTGEGGMLITNNPDYDKQARLLRSHGMTTMSYQRASGHATEYDVVRLGYNYRMDDIHAVIGIAQLSKIEADLIQRVEVRKLYKEFLSSIDGVTIPFAHNCEFVSNYIFPIVLNNFNAQQRDSFRDAMHAKGIQTSIHYPALHKFSIYKGSPSLPKTEQIVNQLVTLPMYASLTPEMINEIAGNVSEIIRALGRA